MNRGMFLAAMALAALMTLEWAEPKPDPKPGDLTITPDGCVVTDDGKDCDAPTTCAECRTDSECEALCDVGPCDEPGQAGCWATIAEDE